MEPHRVIGRYALFDAIAAGGMATVYYGRLIGPVGFTRTVAIKQLHPRFSRDPDFVSMFIDEARVTAHIRHPNVVPVLDVVKHNRELYIIMEYVLGVSLAWLLRKARDRGDRVPIDVVCGILCDCLEGLHAAHETRDEKGQRRGIIHRDVSPGNVMVGRDGIARVLDFGIAKAAGRAQVTRTGEVKGKPSYMAPEQLRGGHVTRATDIHAVAVTMWEALVGTRAFTGPPLEVVRQRQRGKGIPRASELDPELARFDSLLNQGLAQEPDDRWPTAKAMADALRAIQPRASADAIAAWVEHEAETMLDERGRRAAALESGVSPTEIRAAIHADWNAETPMFSAAEGEEPDAGERAAAAGDSDRASSHDGTTLRDEYLVRDLTPTRVERSSSSAAALGPQPAKLEAHDRPDDEETATVPLNSPAGAADDSSATWPAGGTTPPWQDETRPLARRPSERRSQAMGAILVVIALALIAAVFAFARGPVTTEGSDGSRPPTTPTEPGRSPSPPADPEAAATATAAAIPAPADDAPHDLATAPPPVPRSRSTAKSKPKAGSSGTDDPFDELGGRH